MEFVSGCVKAILEKYADPVANKFAGFVKSEWEKFKIDSDMVFINYLENSYEKYSKVKTILYRTEPKFIYNFFEFPNLIKDHRTRIESNDINNLLEVSNFLIIKGTGGIGKSTFMKHLFINELSKKDLIPVFVELKDLNDIEGDYCINDFIFDKLYNLGSEINKDYLEYALQSGCFLFLLDGYDEITSNKKKTFLTKLTNFCDRYSKNYFIVSSRPYSDFVEFQRFTVLDLCTFTKEQAISLIGKIDYDENIKSSFCKALEEELYDRHTSFASNPLLLNIMLLTFDNYAEIPEKLHLFYANAFETLYSKHDATKGGYKRELKSNLSFDLFKKLFSYFCFITYYQGKVEFTYDELVAFLKKVKIENVSFDIESIIDDLVNSICVIYKDGLNYRFAHRSFQEYFTAIFLKELSDENLCKMGLEMIKKDSFRATHDSVFPMLYDMSEERVEQNIFVPLLEKIEANCHDDKYDFYFSQIDLTFEFLDLDLPEDIRLGIRMDTGDENVRFIRRFSFKYRDQSRECSDGKSFLSYLEKELDYEIGQPIKASDYIHINEFADLLRKTWIGLSIETLANLKSILENKKKKGDLDLNELLVS